jgi:hypothetical protein
MVGALGAGLAANSLLGPLALDRIDYSLSASLRNQLIGLDAVSLALVAPLCALAAVLVRRAHVAGALIALAAGSYTAYMFVQYVVGPGNERYPRELAIHLGLFVLGWLVARRAWKVARTGVGPAITEVQRRRLSWALLGLAAFVVARYLPSLAGSVTNEALPQEFRPEPAFFWTILLMDVGIVVPFGLTTAIALRRHAPGATTSTYGLIGWFALVPPSVSGMAIAMLVNDDPNASAGSTALFGIATAVFTVVAVRLYRPLFDRTTSPGRSR